MKIEKVRFKNLNSLVGTWEIDFTQPEFVTNGIFAITGPTGSGKTTILDAICLALYARTPRLERVNNNNNEIMSRNTGECYAEVEFSINQRQYRVHWSQNRARKKSNGNLIPARHELSDISDEEKIISARISIIKEKIPEITGMSFEQFTRSVMLAQGNFAAFLKASNDDRADILEQISGSEIYGEISKEVHIIKKEKEDELNAKKNILKGINFLTQEKRDEIINNLKLFEKQEVENEKKAQEINEKISWHKNIATNKIKIDNINKQILENKKELIKFEPQKIKLDKGKKAATLLSDYNILKTKRNELQKDTTELTTDNKKIPDLKNKKKVIEKNRLQCSINLEETEEKWKKESVVIKDVRELDTQIKEKEKVLQNHKNKLNDLQTDSTQKKDTLLTISKKLEDLDNKLSELKKKEKENKNDGQLISELAVIKTQFNTLQDLQIEISKLDQNISKNSTEIKRDKEKEAEFKTKIAENEKAKLKVELELKVLNEQLIKFLDNSTLSELRNIKDEKLIEISKLNKIVSLENERQNLQNHKPCPLCGSLEHPYAKGNIPKPTILEEEIKLLSNRITNIEIQDKKILGTGNKLKDLLEKKTNIAQEIQLLSQRIALNNKSLLETKKKKKTENTKFAKIKSEIAAILDKYAIDAVLIDNPKKLLSNLELRVTNWKKITTEIEKLKNQRPEINVKINVIKNSLLQIKKSIENESENYKEMERIIKKLTDSRKDIYSDKNPDVEEKDFNDKLKQLNADKELIDEKFNNITNEISVLISNIKRLEQEIENREKETNKLTSLFDQKIQNSDFTDLSDYENAVIEPDLLEKLEKKAMEFKKTTDELRTIQKTLSESLKLEQEKKLTDEPIKDLETQMSKIGDELRKNREQIGAHRNELKTDEQNKKNAEGKLKTIELLEKIYSKWENLHSLIGSADGKKFRNFAQGLTFEIMVTLANKQLKSMSDRYLLIRNDNEPLELNVIDSYQGGEIRPTKNLSGGESFIVSLALALGLSNMASRNTRIDSLFLDEGFGTLDEDALESALETLASLQQEGKLIGIISHVKALKERITTQITLTSTIGGKSKIKGSGVKEI